MTAGSRLAEDVGKLGVSGVGGIADQAEEEVEDPEEEDEEGEEPNAGRGLLSTCEVVPRFRGSRAAALIANRGVEGVGGVGGVCRTAGRADRAGGGVSMTMASTPASASS